MLLTVALPVFNDAKALVASLHSVIFALREVEQPVEVIVSDNCSSDGSFEAAQSTLENLPYSRVVRQSINLGFAGNLKALSELSSGKYIWYLGAGDVLMPGHLSPLIRVLDEESPDFGTLNGRFNFHEFPGKELETTRFSLAQSKQHSSIALFNHAVSLNIIKREIMLNLSTPRIPPTAKITNNQESLPNPLYLWESETSFWPHLEAICQFLELRKSDHESWFQYEGVAVLLDNNKNGNWDKGLSAVKIFVEWASVARRTASAVPKARAAQRLDGILHGKHLLKFLFMIRKDGTIPPYRAVEQIKSMDINFAIRYLSLLISHLPIPVVRSLVFARSLFIKPARSG